MEQILTPAVMEVPGVDILSRIGGLFDRHQARLYRMALRMSGDAEEARDLVQETFLRAASHPASVPEDDRGAEAWLVRVLINLCRDRFRRLRVRGSLEPQGHAPEPSEDPEPLRLMASAVQSALAALPARRRAVVVLHELDERPVSDIARLLGIHAVTVRWHLSRARRELRHRLAGTPPERGET